MRTLGLLLGLCILVWATSAVASADTLSGLGNPNTNPSLAGGTVINFDSGPTGLFNAITFGNTTFTGIGAPVNIGPDFNGSFNTRGVNSMFNGFDFVPASFRFDFANPVSAFGFNWGAADNTWVMNAYNSAGVLLETFAVPGTFSSNAGEYFGIAADGIKYATITDQKNKFAEGDYVFIDNFTSVEGGGPEFDVGSAFMMLPMGGAFGPTGGGDYGYDEGGGVMIALSFLGNLGGGFPGNVINFAESYNWDGVTLNTSGQEYGIFAAVDAVGFSPHTYTGDPIPVDPDVQIALEAGTALLREHDPAFPPPELLAFPELIGFNEPGALAMITQDRLIEYFLQFDPNLGADPTFQMRLTDVLVLADPATLDFSDQGDVLAADGEDILFPHMPGFESLAQLIVNINWPTVQRDGTIPSGAGSFGGSTKVVPEPSTLALLALGVAGAFLARRRRRV